MNKCYSLLTGAEHDFTTLDADFVKVKLLDGTFSILGAGQEFSLSYSLTPITKKD